MNDTSVSASALVPGTSAGDTESVREAVAAAWDGTLARLMGHDIGEGGSFRSVRTTRRLTRRLG
jgi:hypothetical protein